MLTRGADTLEGAEGSLIIVGDITAGQAIIIGFGNLVGYKVTASLMVKPAAGSNWTAVDAELRVISPGGIDRVLRPQARDYPGLMGGAPVETKEADFITLAGGHLFANIGQSVSGEGPTRYQIAVKWMPLVYWIWIGGGMIALGGTLAMLGRAQLLDGWRRRRRAKAEARFA